MGDKDKGLAKAPGGFTMTPLAWDKCVWGGGGDIGAGLLLYLFCLSQSLVEPSRARLGGWCSRKSGVRAWGLVC